MIKTGVADRDIKWHPNQNYTYKQYMNALDDVFNSLWFDNAKERFDLIGSYRMNLRHLVIFAVDTKVDEIKFIQSLRQVLLELPGCKEVER